MHSVKFVIFDLGGVLVNWHMSWITNEISQKFGISEDVLVPVFSKYLPLLDSGYLEEREFWKSVGSDTRANQLANVTTSLWYDIFREKASLNSDVFNILKRLKRKVRLAALSNIEEKTYSVISEWGLMSFFEFQFLSYRVGYSKPDYRIYKHVIDSLPCDPHEMLFIDDKIENVESAKKSGINSIKYESSKMLEKSLTEIHLL